MHIINIDKPNKTNIGPLRPNEPNKSVVGPSADFFSSGALFRFFRPSRVNAKRNKQEDNKKKNGRVRALSSSCAKSLERMRAERSTGRSFGLRETPLETDLTTRKWSVVEALPSHSPATFSTLCHREGDEVGAPIGSKVISGN